MWIDIHILLHKENPSLTDIEMPNTDNDVVGNGGWDSDTTRDAESRDALSGSGKVTFLRQSYLDHLTLVVFAESK